MHLLTQIYGIDKDQIYWRNTSSYFLVMTFMSIMAYLVLFINSNVSYYIPWTLWMIAYDLATNILVWLGLLLIIRGLKTTNAMLCAIIGSAVVVLLYASILMVRNFDQPGVELVSKAIRTTQVLHMIVNYSITFLAYGLLNNFKLNKYLSIGIASFVVSCTTDVTKFLIDKYVYPDPYGVLIHQFGTEKTSYSLSWGVWLGVLLVVLLSVLFFWLFDKLLKVRNQ